MCNLVFPNASEPVSNLVKVLKRSLTTLKLLSTVSAYDPCSYSDVDRLAIPGCRLPNTEGSLPGAVETFRTTERQSDQEFLCVAPVRCRTHVEQKNELPYRTSRKVDLSPRSKSTGSLL